MKILSPEQFELLQSIEFEPKKLNNVTDIDEVYTHLVNLLYAEFTYKNDFDTSTTNNPFGTLTTHYQDIHITELGKSKLASGRAIIDNYENIKRIAESAEAQAKIATQTAEKAESKSRAANIKANVSFVIYVGTFLIALAVNHAKIITLVKKIVSYLGSLV